MFLMSFSFFSSDSFLFCKYYPRISKKYICWACSYALEEMFFDYLTSAICQWSTEQLNTSFTETLQSNDHYEPSFFVFNWVNMNSVQMCCSHSCHYYVNSPWDQVGPDFKVILKLGTSIWNFLLFSVWHMVSFPLDVWNMVSISGLSGLLQVVWFTILTSACL